MSQDNNINGKIPPISQPPLNADFTKAAQGKGTIALKALLQDLEELLTTFTGAATSGSGPSSKEEKLVLLLQNDPVAFAQLLKKTKEGSSGGAEFHEVVQTISTYIASTKGYDNSKAAQAVKELFKGTAEEKESAKFEATALKMLGTFTKKVDSGETSFDEGLESGPMQAFIGELSDKSHLSNAQAVRASLAVVFEGKEVDDEFIGKVIDISVNASASKTNDGKQVLDTLTSPTKLTAIYNSANKNQVLTTLAQKADAPDDGETYIQAMIKMAVSLVGLLGNVYESQNATNDINSKISQMQASNAKTIASNNINSLQAQLTAQAAAGKEPWYMYLVAAVVAVVGAAATFFTAGAAGPAAAAIVLLIGGVMASPAGSAITGSLSKAFGGGNDTPGSQAAAGAVVAIFTTILSLGAAGFASAADVVTDEVTEDVSSSITEAAAKAPGGALGNVAGEVGGEEIDAAEEEIVTTTVNSLEKGGKEAVSNTSKFAEKIKNSLNQKWSNGAFTEGIVKRAVGTYIQGFLGTGGLTNSAEAIGLAFDPKLLDSQGAAIAFAVVGAALAIVGTMGAGKLAGAGFKVRAAFLEENNLENTVFRASKLMDIGARVIQAGGGAAQGGFAISQGSQEVQVANLQELTSISQGAQTVQNNVQQQAFGLQTDTNKAYSEMVSALNDTLNQALQTIGVEEQNNKRTISR